MTPDPLAVERIHQALAEGIDRAGPDLAALFLAKASLLLAVALDDPDRALALIRDAGEDLDPPRIATTGNTEDA
jgi:hypothetical protein